MIELNVCEFSFHGLWEDNLSVDFFKTTWLVAVWIVKLHYSTYQVLTEPARLLFSGQFVSKSQTSVWPVCLIREVTH